MRNGLAAIGLLAALWGGGFLNTASAAQHAFRVSLRDKAGSPALSAASQFLSARSLARRQAFGIGLDESDRPVSQAYVDTALQLTGGVMHLRSRWLNYIVLLTDDSSDIVPLAAKPWVTSVEYIAYYPIGLHNRAAGGKGESSWDYTATAKTAGSAAYYDATWDQTNLVKGDYLHDQGFKGTGKLIAVLDAGFTDVNMHPGFATLFSDGRLVDMFDFVRARPGQIYNYGNHGTQVLSIMAGDLPNDYIGSAPEAMYALYVTEDNGSEQLIELDNLLAGAERADSIGADVINASLGYNFFAPLTGTSLSFSQLDGKTTIAAKAANAAARKGILFVGTAGNEGGNSWNRIITPGDADSALIVGSVDVSRNPQSTTGVGPNAAGKVKPDIVALGVNAAFFISPANIATGTGTSYAAPNIAGFVACLMEGRPGKSPMDVIKAVIRTGDRYSAPTSVLGHGVPNFQQAYSSLGVPDTEGKAQTPVFALSSSPGAASEMAVYWQGSKAGAEWSLAVQDAVGRLVWKSDLTTTTVAGHRPLGLRQLSAGMYFLRITGSGAAQTVRFIVR